MHRNTRSHRPELIPLVTDPETLVRRPTKNSKDSSGSDSPITTQPPSSTYCWVEVDRLEGGLVGD